MTKINENRKGYKKTKVGWIPKDWDVKKLRDISDVFSSNVDKLSLHNERDIYLCNYMDVFKNDYITKKISFMKATATDNEINKFSLKLNDVIITKDSETQDDIAKSAVVSENLTNVLCGYHLCLIRPKPIIIGRFLSKIFCSYKIHQEFVRLTNGITRFGLTVPTIENALIPFPKITEQQKIAEILSTWDEAIEKTEKLITAKQKLKTGILQKIYSRKLKSKKLKNYIDEVSNKNNDLKIQLVLSVTNSNGFINQEDQFERQVASKDLSSYKIVKKGQFAYNPSRINVGSIDLLESFEEGIVSPIYVAFETKEKELSKYYFKYFLQTNLFKQQMKKYFAGSVRESLTFSGLSFIKIPLADITKQKYFVNILLTIDKEINLLNQKLNKLQEQKKGLMQVLLTGKLRVKLLKGDDLNVKKNS